MSTALRGLGLGAAFGLAASGVEMWLNFIPLMDRRMGPGPAFLAQTAALEIALCAALGLLAAPLLRLRRGALLHVLALALAWAAAAKWVELNSALFARLQFVPPALGALLMGLGLWIARRSARLAVGLGAALLAAGIAAPDIYLGATTPESPARVSRPPRPGAPDVVLVVLDTVRAESVSAYGYARDTSPRFDALAREGALFLDATSPSTWSLASHASLFTGRFPSSHGAHMENRYLDDRFPTLADALASRGYDTRCFTANAWISDGLGLTRGFAWQDTSWKEAQLGRLFAPVYRLAAKFGFETDDKGGGVVAEHFADWMRQRPPDADPVFVFLNFIEAHFPYHQLPDEYLHRFTQRPRGELREISLELLGAQFGGVLDDPAAAMEPALDMYDGGIVYTDKLLGQVVDAIAERGTLDRTILVVLADHGEVLGEHGDFFGHGPSLYEPMIRVPLVVRYPPRVEAGVRVGRAISTVGVYATILDLAEIEAPPTLQVGSLLPVIAGEPGGGPVLSERHRAVDIIPLAEQSPDPQMQPELRYRAYRDGAWKLVEMSDGSALLYDVAADPGESRNLAPERPDVLARVRADLGRVRAELELPALDAARDAGDSPELDDATQQRLRELGYIE